MCHGNIFIRNDLFQCLFIGWALNKLLPKCVMYREYFEWKVLSFSLGRFSKKKKKTYTNPITQFTPSSVWRVQQNNMIIVVARKLVNMQIRYIYPASLFDWLAYWWVLCFFFKYFFLSFVVSYFSCQFVFRTAPTLCTYILWQIRACYFQHYHLQCYFISFNFLLKFTW